MLGQRRRWASPVEELPRSKKGRAPERRGLFSQGREAIARGLYRGLRVAGGERMVAFPVHLRHTRGGEGSPRAQGRLWKK